MLTKNKPIKYSLLIKSILLLPDDNRMNKKTNKLLWYISIWISGLYYLCMEVLNNERYTDLQNDAGFFY